VRDLHALARERIQCDAGAVLRLFELHSPVAFFELCDSTEPLRERLSSRSAVVWVQLDAALQPADAVQVRGRPWQSSDSDDSGKTLPFTSGGDVVMEDDDHVDDPINTYGSSVRAPATVPPAVSECSACGGGLVNVLRGDVREWGVDGAALARLSFPHWLRYHAFDVQLRLSAAPQSDVHAALQRKGSARWSGTVELWINVSSTLDDVAAAVCAEVKQRFPRLVSRRADAAGEGIPASHFRILKCVTTARSCSRERVA
jgi:hypothetical protein